MVEVGASQVETLPAQELDAWGIAGDRKGEGLPPVVISQPMGRYRVYGNLI